jgi:GMP synthase-like glutamine amidotransferase
VTSARALVVDNGSLSIGAVRKAFATLDVDTDVVKAAEVPDRIGPRHQALVLSGTKVRAYDTGFYRRLVNLVFESSVPVWGICGGMQIIGTAAGAELASGKSRVGNHPVHLDKQEPVFADAKPTVTLFQRHMLYLREAPPGFTIIGWSDDAPVEFIRSRDGRIYGSQAHLEFRNDGLAVLQGFVALFS